MSIDPLILELVARYEQLCRQGHAITPEELCRDCPDKLDEVRRRIRDLQDVQRRLDTDAEPGPGTSPLPQTGDGSGASSASPADLPPLRYRPLRLHAGGGMGEVYLAEDTEFDRTVALKRIKAQFADNPDNRRRFLLEAEVTARLEHPGIVPVYGKGRDEVGVPCYAMRFLQGGTLQDAIQEFHKADTPGREPSERQLALRQLLTQFIGVCNTVAYAHSRGIIHRDLKPANVVLGKYGETLVVDWGLARRFERTQAQRASGEQTLTPAAAGSGSETQWGQALGTPSYMSPEQARGEWDRIDLASDIYSLGAILYAVLTGQAPFQGLTAQQIVDKLRRGERPPAPRMVKHTCSRSLEAVCLKATAGAPEARYATALDLAGDVDHWLADEPVGAWRESLPARLGRWARRHKSLLAGVTAVALTALLLGGFDVGWWQWQRAVAAQAAMPDIRKAEEVLQQLADPTEAGHALDRADIRLAREGSAILRDRIERLRQDLALVTELEQARLKAATWRDSGFDYAGANHGYEAAFANHGLDLTTLAPEDAVRLIRGRSVRTRVALALDDWAYVKERLPNGNGEPLRAIARLVDDDHWRQQFRATARDKDPAGLERLAQGEDILEQPLASLVLLHYALREQKRLDADERLLRQAQQRYPSDFWLNFELGYLLRQKRPEGLADAIVYYRAALNCQPGNPAVHNNLGVVLQDQGNLAEAVAEYRYAIALDPDYAMAHSNLGGALRAQRKWKEAIDECHRALKLNSKSASAHTCIGLVSREQKMLREAEEEFHQALTLDPNYAPAHTGLGLLRHAEGNLAAAITEFHQALSSDPNYIDAHTALGVVLQKQGNLDEASTEFRRTIALDPKNASVHNILGLGLLMQGNLDEATAEFRRAIALDPQQALYHGTLGVVLNIQGELEYAIAECRQAIALDPKDANAHAMLGHALFLQGRFTDAVASAQRYLELLPLNHPQRPAGIHDLEIAKRLLALEPKLVVLTGDVKPANTAEGLDYGRLCSLKRLYARSYRLYAEAFAADAKVAEDLQGGHRFNAACAAALAGCGQGMDATQIADQERAGLRRQALFWLREDLTARVKLLEAQRDKAVDLRTQMLIWQHWPELAVVRDKEALAKLPADERQDWQKLWDDVEALRQRAWQVKVK